MAILDNFLFVGDSFTNGLKTYGISSSNGKNCKFVCKVGITAKELAKKTYWNQMPNPKDVKGVVLLVGVNGWQSNTNGNDIDTLIKKLLDKYSNCNVYVQRVFPVNSDYDKGYSGGWKNCNSAIAKINSGRKAFCDKTSRAIYIDTTKGFSSNAVLNKSESHDGLHILDYGKWQNNIVEAIKNAQDINNTGGANGSVDPSISNGYPSIVKKLLPDSLAGSSYEKEGFTPQFIIIHNMGGGGNQTSYNYWAAGSDGRKTSAHYCVEPQEIWQTLEDTWVGHHIGSGCAGNKGYDAGARNKNSFGIEMADGDNIDKEAALETTIELTRYLMKTHNIPFENIYKHNDVSGNRTDCPWWINKHKKWDYFLNEVKKRNENNEPIKLNVDGNNFNSNFNNVGTLPNFDNREDLTNIEQVKGVVLVHHPPEHFYSKKNKTEVWEKEGYDRNFHFEVDSVGFKTKVDNTLITWGMQPNDKHTYIDRALFNNKPYKYVLNIGIFTSENLEDYTVTEKILIDRIGKVLWENGLETKDLWREFDLNRAPSPFMYLEREQWKKFLREVDKQIKWRYENFGEPPVGKKEDEERTFSDSEIAQKKENIGKTGRTIKQCSLWKIPKTNVEDRIKILKKGTKFVVTDFDKGFYQVEFENIVEKGWIWLDSVEIDGETTEEEESYNIKTPNDSEEDIDTTPPDGDGSDNTIDDNPDSDPEEDKSGGKNIPQPEIIPTMTHEEFLKWKSFTDPRLIDNFAGECEPYDKGLEAIINSEITEDDRLQSLTQILDTRNENTIYFNCVEGSPGGDGSHCAKNANELNMLIKPDAYRVDPVYPDLIVPPNYSTADYNVKSSNALPFTVLTNGIIKDEKDFDASNLTFDYDLLKDKEKKSKGKPVNYLDPYPYDDKIYELENHKPKVKIDEIEARLYDSNHPGDPVAHPIAKNFANVYDMAINQSKKIESRLVRIENTLATVLRNLGRIGSRINVNCVYYGGQDVFGKYKTIRCLRDDRVHDACSVTLDQCLCCTRYEPILGQIYEILDDTGVNGSVMLDQMQMSYMDLEETRNLNRVEERNTTRKFADVNRQEKETPKKMLEEWEETDKNKYIEQLKKDVTDEKELEEAIGKIKQEDYAFKMNWINQDLDLQEPDVKLYPTEGIKAKYKNTDIEEGIIEKDVALDDIQSRTTIDIGNNEIDVDTTPDEGLIDETDKDYTDDLSKLDKLNQGEWVDTREEADTHETNWYTSEDYFFEGFNSNNSSGGSGFGAEARTKITEMARQIVQDHNDLKACYDQTFRTTDYNNPNMGYDSRISTEKVVGYDCSSLVSCCYNNAGLKEATNKTTSALWDYSKVEGVKTWNATMESASEALPGDIILGQGHTGIYMGNNEVAHASGKRYPKKGDIRIDPLENALQYSFKAPVIFLRPADLIAADAKASAGNGTCPSNVKGPAVCAPSNALIREIKGFEGFARKTDYYNKESWKTGGYGIIEPNKSKWYYYMEPWPTTEQKASEALVGYLKDDFCSVIWKGIQQNNAEGKFTQHQFDAFVSLGHNWNPYKVIKANFFKKLCANPNDTSAIEEWKRTATTVKATGQQSSWLKERRLAETKMYLTGEYTFNKISIWDGAGKHAGHVSDNNGHGWLPGPIN